MTFTSVTVAIDLPNTSTARVEFEAMVQMRNGGKVIPAGETFSVALTANGSGGVTGSLVVPATDDPATTAVPESSTPHYRVRVRFANDVDEWFVVVPRADTTPNLDELPVVASFSSTTASVTQSTLDSALAGHLKAYAWDGAAYTVLGDPRLYYGGPNPKTAAGGRDDDDDFWYLGEPTITVAQESELAVVNGAAAVATELAAEAPATSTVAVEAAVLHTTPSGVALAFELDAPGADAYVELPGTNGNYLSTPDAASLDITGDIDLRVRVAMDDWTPGTTSALLAKYLGSGGSDSFIFGVDGGTGKLRAYWTETGSTLKSTLSTVATPAADGAPLWVRVTLDVDNGAGGHDVKFYTSTDGVSWTQLGTTYTGSGTTSIFAGTQPVSLGGYATGAGALTAGKIYAAQVRNGIGGTIVANFDADDFAYANENTATDSTGKVWTVNRSSSGQKAAVVRPVELLVDGNAYGDLDVAGTGVKTVTRLRGLAVLGADAGNVTVKVSASGGSGDAQIHARSYATMEQT